MNYAEDLIHRLRDAAKVSEALAIFFPHSDGGPIARLLNEAADYIELKESSNE